MDSIIESFRTSLNEIMALREIDSVGLGRELGIDPSIVRRWRNKGVDVRLNTLIKLADYFECSIDYLCGKAYECERFESRGTYPRFGERLVKVMNELNIRPCNLFDKTNIIQSKYYYWLNGGEPSLTSLALIAESLNISFDYLVGRQAK